MRIFDDIPRDYDGPAAFAEPQFMYYNRSARPYVVRLREQLEEWFAAYPPDHQAALRRRLRSTFDEGFLELVIFALLRGLGYSVEVHPTTSGTIRQPDYLAVTHSGVPEVYVECTVIHDSSDAETARRGVIYQVFDAINAFVHPDFIFGVTSVTGNPTGRPAQKRVHHHLRELVRDLDPDATSSRIEESAGRWSPRQTFREAGMNVQVFAIPKRREVRGKPGVRSLAMGPVEVAWGGGRVASLLTSLKRKAGRYGKLPGPYVIAANAASKWGIDNLAVTEALFGREGPVFMPGSRNVAFVPSGDGLLVHGGHAVNTRVSAILVFYGLAPSNVGSCQYRLFHNPWAARPVTGPLTTLRQAVRRDDALVAIDGLSLSAVLHVPEGWPVLNER